MYNLKGNKILFLTSAILAAILITSIVLFVCFRLDDDEIEDNYDPEQIHLAIGEDSSQMVISWSTRSDPGQSFVRFGEITCNQTRLAVGTKRVLDSNGLIQYIHFVTLRHLIPQIKYCYYVGSEKKWSRSYQFYSFPNHPKWSPSIALIGDMGAENGRSIPSLINSTIQGYFDAVIHVGDIGYNLFAFKGLMGDKFMRNIEPIAARIPYMVVPGNHEYVCYDMRCPSDFGISYETRFKMPKSADNAYYTFTLGSALFIGISTEVYFQQEMTDLNAYQTQYDWLQNVLIEANKPENRARHPWIIVYGHRPLYCTSIGECRDGMTVLYQEGEGIDGSLFDIEDLLYAYGVDVAFWGHQHYYERSYPVYNQTVYYSSIEDAFVNPRAPVHIVSGVGGMHSGTERFDPTPAIWTAFRSSAYGYTHFIVANETHLFLEQIDVDQNDSVIDSFWIIQEDHSPFDEKNKDLE